jgi:hypothetical protein
MIFIDGSPSPAKTGARDPLGCASNIKRLVILPVIPPRFVRYSDAGARAAC